MVNEKNISHNEVHFDETRLRSLIREEVNENKKCFTTFFINTLGACAISLGMMFGAINDYEIVVFAAIPLVMLLMAVGRIGVFKYTTVNRNTGFELHLNRITQL